MITAFLFSLTAHLVLFTALVLNPHGKPGKGPGESGQEQGGQHEKEKQFQPKTEDGKAKEQDAPVEVTFIQLPRPQASKLPCDAPYGGVGLKSFGPQVEEVAPGYAADRAGIKVGDWILNKWHAQDLRGEPGTHVTIIVERKGQRFVFDVVREKICMKAD